MTGPMRISCALIKPVTTGQEVTSWLAILPAFDAELSYLSARELERAQSLRIASEVEFKTRWLDIFANVKVRWRIRAAGQLYEITELVQADVTRAFCTIRAQIRPGT